MKYRSEIDGLRAIAVIPVIFFHAGINFFSGGFIGVDVFFVISGYLITTILIESLEDNQLNLIHFYERRARRILPALFVVMISCIPFSIKYLPPHELRDFFQSIVAVSLFSSNFLFWIEEGYFDSEAADKPLLHTWSLAVEEQFYVLFPLFLMLLWRYGKSKVFWILVVTTLISLILSEWGWRYKASANFYLAPTRAWELLTGSIAAFIVNSKGVKKNNVLAIIGLMAIILSIFTFDKDTPFPSFYTSIPVLGVFLIIVFASEETLTARLLSFKPLVAVGLISYSAYLWHQPIIVFSKLYLLKDLTTLNLFFIFIVLMFLSWSTWRFIETPFRKSEAISRRHIFSFSIIFISAFIFLGSSYNLNIIPNKTSVLGWNGIDYDLPKKFGGIYVDGKNCSELSPEFTCEFGQNENRIVIIGDSHARVLTQPAYQRYAEENFKFYDMSASGCPFLYGLNTYSNGKLLEKCNADYQVERLIFLKSLKPSTIVLHSRLPLYLHGDGFDNTVGGKEPSRSYYSGLTGQENQDERYLLIKNSFLLTVRKILESNHDLIIVSPVPTNGWHPIKRLISVTSQNQNVDTNTLRSIMAVPKIAVEQRQTLSNAIFDETMKKFPSVKLLNTTDLLCDLNVCHAVSPNGNILYSDRDHLSFFAADLLFKRLMNELMLNDN